MSGEGKVPSMARGKIVPISRARGKETNGAEEGGVEMG